MSELFTDHVTGSFAETVPRAVSPSVIVESKLLEVSTGAVISVTYIVISEVDDVLL